MARTGDWDIRSVSGGVAISGLVPIFILKDPSCFPKLVPHGL